MPQYMRQGYGKMLIDFSKCDCCGLSSTSRGGDESNWVSGSWHAARGRMCGQNLKVPGQLVYLEPSVNAGLSHYLMVGHVGDRTEGCPHLRQGAAHVC